MKVALVQEKIKKEGLSSFLFSSRPNVFYLSRFNSSYAFVLLTPQEKYFITDNRYYQGAKKKLKDWQVILLGEGGKKADKHLIEIINNLGGGKIGFEEDRTTLSFYKKLKEGVDGSLVGYAGFLSPFRMSKTKWELGIIKKAVEKTDRVFQRLLEYIPKATTELDVRREAVNLFFKEGATGESFPTIVATGKNSAIPHHETSTAKIKNNAPLLIDMGLVYKGYCSDFTRTIFVGKVSQKLKDIYNIVKEAHLSAVEKVKEGVPVKEVDQTARDIIARYGYGDYFIHSTGHGVGIEIHEPPRVSKHSEEVLTENCVITVEPGIYIPSVGGVRLENVVVAKKRGGQILTKTPLDIVEL
ncbi:MAG: aminopeptidase P family protein [Aquificae bacterium]|nr:aminopeptidase P family protein [Aquificota bacterium]